MNKDPSQIVGDAASHGPLLSAISGETEPYEFDAAFATNAAERLFVLETPRTAPARRRFAAFFAACLFIHAGVLFALLYDFDFLAPPPQEQEIPVEVVMVPPPPPPPPPKQLDLPSPNETPPPPPYEKPSTDAPRAANNEKIDQKAPDDVSQAPKVAPSAGQAADAPPADKAASAATPAKAHAKAASPLPTFVAPDAEPLPSAKAEQDATEQNDAQARDKAQEDDAAERMAALFANMKQLPNIKFGAAAGPTPVSGGKGDNRYTNQLWGLIMPHMHVPERLTSNPQASPVVIAFQIDGSGKLVSQAVIRSSGFADLDMAALFAIREGSPFPPPPGGIPVGLTFTY